MRLSIIYNIVGIYAFNIGYLELWSNRSLMVSGSDLTITPLQTGIGVYTAVTSNKTVPEVLYS